MHQHTILAPSPFFAITHQTSKDVPTAATEGARVGETRFRMIRPDKTLAERLEDAYRDDALGSEERGLLDRAANQFGRRLSDEE